MSASLNVFVRQARLEALAIASFDLESADGSSLPPFAPGAHIDLHIPGGPLRSYSLIGCGERGDAYRIAVKRDAASRGGSAWLHDSARIGAPLQITVPKSHFALVDAAPASVFIAGGIGITPVLSMIGRLVELGRPWELHYAASSSEHMPFQALLERQAEQGRGRVLKYFSAGSSGRLDVPAVVTQAPAQAHLYCCGPARMIDDFLAATRGRAPGTVHHERFTAAQAADTRGGYTLQLARDGRCLSIAAGQSMLEVLLDAGIDVPYSCMQGICGSCQTRVLEGVPDHRDDVLTFSEKAANDTVILCCSGARTDCITLDL